MLSNACAMAFSNDCKYCFSAPLLTLQISFVLKKLCCKDQVAQKTLNSNEFQHFDGKKDKDWHNMLKKSFKYLSYQVAFATWASQKQMMVVKIRIELQIILESSKSKVGKIKS